MKKENFTIMLFLIGIILYSQQFGSSNIGNNAFQLSSTFGDLQMRRYHSNDLKWKRALVPTPSELIINYGGDFKTGTRLMGARLNIDSMLIVGTTLQVKSLINEGILIGKYNDKLSWNGTGKQPGYHIRFAGYRDIIHNFTGAQISALRTNICCEGRSQGMELAFSVMRNSATTSGYDNLKEAMRIASNGNVGIGTINPDQKLTVKGVIHAQEVQVDLTGAIAPDYVFEKYYEGASELKADYTMLTLEEVAQFTKEYKHLPNIPSAQELEENGMHLKEMTRLLLQKIEELTLYTIEQQKEIQVLKESKEIQDQKIQRLESQIQ